MMTFSISIPDRNSVVRWEGAPFNDPAKRSAAFLDVSRTIEKALRDKGYFVSTPDASRADMIQITVEIPS